MDVDKSAYHHQSQSAIAGGKACSQHLTGDYSVFDYRVCQPQTDFTPLKVRVSFSGPWSPSFYWLLTALEG
jgi:hypothetical protein